MLRMRVIAAQPFVSAVAVQILLQRGYGALSTRLTSHGQVGWRWRGG